LASQFVFSFHALLFLLHSAKITLLKLLRKKVESTFHATSIPIDGSSYCSPFP
jgi:hypothetical protein